MGKRRHTPDEIVSKLRQLDVLTAQGRTVAEAIRQIGVTEVTYYRWRNEYGGHLPDGIDRQFKLGLFHDDERSAAPHRRTPDRHDRKPGKA